MSYTKINWADGEAGGTPINAANLDHMDQAIYDVDLSNITGWYLLNATLTYSSADAPTFIATTSVDLTGTISVGMKLKLTQTTVKYFIVTAITASTITLYGGTDYTLANATITNVYFSNVKSPFGFPMNPDKWSVKFIYGDMALQSSPTQNTWYNLGSSYLDVPIGEFNISYTCNLSGYKENTNFIELLSTLSIYNNTDSNSDKRMKGCVSLQGATATLTINSTINRQKIIKNTSKTRYYLLALSTVSGVGQLYFRGDLAATEITAVCAYL